jgi:hypothetical protein
MLSSTASAPRAPEFVSGLSSDRIRNRIRSDVVDATCRLPRGCTRNRFLLVITLRLGDDADDLHDLPYLIL